MTNLFTSRITKQNGFTLVELLVAIALSVILLNGVIQMFVSSKQSYRTADGLGRMQETARYALDVLAQDIRLAGFLPCRIAQKGGIDQIANVLNDTSGAFDFFGAPIQGFDGSGGSFSSGFPAVGSTSSDRLAGADGFQIIRGNGDVYSVASHNPTSAQFKLNQDHNFVDDDIVLVCDNENASLFQITNANQANVTIVHNTGRGTPGNCTKGLGYPVSCTANGTPYAYGEGSQVVCLSSVIYYIGPSLANEDTGRTIPDTNSLYREVLVNGSGCRGSALAAGGTKQELVDGIETMQIVYGVSTDPNSAAVRYTSADNITATDWANVVSVRVGLLLHTPEEVSNEDETRTYGVVGTSVSADTGTVTYPSDRRQRYIFSETIQIRNRGPSVSG